MSEAPIRVDSRAWTGEPTIPPIEHAVLPPKGNTKRTGKTWIFTLLVALVGMLAWTPIELLVWRVSGSLPYFDPGIDFNALLVGVVSGAGSAAVLLLIGRRTLLPLVPLPAILGVGLAGSAHYIEASSTEDPLETTAFYVRSLNLKHNGRSLHLRRFRASAELIDRAGRRWTLNGRYAYIRQLEGQDCLFVTVRNTGIYRFAVGPLTLVETPYVDSATGKRRPERCFANPPLKSVRT